MSSSVLERGRNVWPVLLALAWYFGIGAIVFWLFYSHYDEQGVASEDTFKLIFSLTLGGLLATTLACAALAARAFKSDVPLIVMAMGVTLVVVLLHSLAVLTLVNDCLGVTFPWDGGCPN